MSAPWETFPAADDRVLRPDHASYPVLLEKAFATLPTLWVRGELPDAPAVAIVGSRRATEYGLGVAEHLGHELGRRGVTVVSGLAVGIDGAAHRGALAAGGRTVAVLAGGIDRLYPPRHLALAHAIRHAGAVVTEEEPGADPAGWRFPKRNAIIAALCAGIVVVEATQKSGAMLTAGHALRFGREVLAVPGSIFSPTSRGTNELIAQGCAPARSVDDVLRAMNLEAIGLGAPLPPSGVDADPPAAPVDDLAMRLHQLLRDTPRHLDDLSGRLRAPVWQVASALTRLELMGLAVSAGPSLFVRRRRSGAARADASPPHPKDPEASS